jgi:hypothetical protein
VYRKTYKAKSHRYGILWLSHRQVLPVGDDGLDYEDSRVNSVESHGPLMVLAREVYEPSVFLSPGDVPEIVFRDSVIPQTG